MRPESPQQKPITIEKACSKTSDCATGKSQTSSSKRVTILNKEKERETNKGEKEIHQHNADYCP
jgi:hypothetical protein